MNIKMTKEEMYEWNTSEYKRLPRTSYAKYGSFIDNLVAESYQAKRIFVFEIKTIFGKQEHDICSDCKVDFYNPREGECTDDCRCTEGDCLTLHIQNEASEGCDCEHCQDHWRDIGDTLRKQEQEGSL